MRIQVKKFGEVLTSRQSGREAYAALQPTLVGLAKDDTLTVDFEGVTVLSPSWADEFLTPLLQRLGDRLTLATLENPSVQLTIETIEGILRKKFSVQPPSHSGGK